MEIQTPIKPDIPPMTADEMVQKFREKYPQFYLREIVIKGGAD